METHPDVGLPFDVTLADGATPHHRRRREAVSLAPHFFKSLAHFTCLSPSATRVRYPGPPDER